MSPEVITAICGSSVFSALIGAVVSIVTIRSEREERKQIRKEDREEKDKTEKDNLKTQITESKEDIQDTSEKLDFLLKEFKEYKDNNEKLANAIIHSNKLLMQDRIRQEAEHAIKKGTITYEKRKFLHDMWDAYHNDWKGNGDLNLVMELVDELPLEVK